MRGPRRLRICVTALAVLFTVALPASAQLTTGSVSGTVKDAQGGVIPGATVTLVSETRGTSGGRVLQLRADMFNAPNNAQIIARQNSLTLGSPTDPVTPLNLPYDPATGAILSNRMRPNQAGSGAVTMYQPARNVQGYIRFSF